MSTFLQSLHEAQCGTFEVFSFEYQFRSALYDLWKTATEPEDNDLQAPQSSASLDLSTIQLSVADDVMFSTEFSTEPDPRLWAVAFTPTFRKSVASVDKNLQGRVLAAISKLTETPIAMHGDTKKPLIGKLKGLWRYRVGDYRLVYEPREDKHIVVLVDFSARGSVYE